MSKYGFDSHLTPDQKEAIDARRRASEAAQRQESERRGSDLLEKERQKQIISEIVSDFNRSLGLGGKLTLTNPYKGIGLGLWKIEVEKSEYKTWTARTGNIGNYEYSQRSGFVGDSRTASIFVDSQTYGSGLKPAIRVYKGPNAAVTEENLEQLRQVLREQTGLEVS